MKDVGIQSVIDKMARAAFKAGMNAKTETDAVRLIIEALKPGVLECVEIGMDQAIIATDNRKRTLRW